MQEDRRSFVAVDLHGEVFSAARWTIIKTEIVNGRPGEPEQYLPVDAMTAQLAAKLTARLAALLDEA